MRAADHHVSLLGGFRTSLTITVLYLGFFVVIPLGVLLWQLHAMSLDLWWQLLASPRVLAAFRVTFGTAAVAAIISMLIGGLIAWVLVRYEFPGKGWLDAMIDLPFALPTAVAGIALTALYAPDGLFGAPLQRIGIQVAYTPLGIVVAMVFIGLPFVVRSLQPVLLDLEPEVEEAAMSLGANRWHVLFRVLFPQLRPALMTGCALAFARSLGEYGTVIFIAGNVPYLSEVVSLLIMIELEQYNDLRASAIACMMLVISFVLLFIINMLQRLVAQSSHE